MCPLWILCFLFNLITKGSKISYWKARVISIYRVSYAAPRFVRTCSWGKVSSDWSPCPDLRSSGGILAELWGRTVIWGPLLWFASRGAQGEGPDHQGDTGGHSGTQGNRGTQADTGTQGKGPDQLMETRNRGCSLEMMILTKDYKRSWSVDFCSLVKLSARVLNWLKKTKRIPLEGIYRHDSWWWCPVASSSLFVAFPLMEILLLPPPRQSTPHFLATTSSFCSSSGKRRTQLFLTISRLSSDYHSSAQKDGSLAIQLGDYVSWHHCPCYHQQCHQSHNDQHYDNNVEESSKREKYKMSILFKASE